MVFSLPQAPFSVFWEGTKRRSHGPCLQKITGRILSNKKKIFNAGGLGVGGFPAKESACNAGDLGLIPGSRRSPGEENDNPLHYSCLENPTDRGAWWATVCTHAVTSVCLTVCDPVDYSPPGSSVHGILQARILEWVAISYSKGSSRPRDLTCISHVSCIGRWVLYHYGVAERHN